MALRSKLAARTPGRKVCKGKGSQAVDPLRRLKELADKFHSKADKSVPLRKFVAKLSRISRMRSGRCSKARRYAAHVAAWLGFAPAAYLPGATEMNLLDGFLLEVGGGQLPARLQRILPMAQAALVRVGYADPARTTAQEKLEDRLHHFLCCRSLDCGPQEQEEEESEGDGDEEDRQAWQQASCGSGIVLQVDSSEDETEQVDCDSQCAEAEFHSDEPDPLCKGTPQHLLRRINQWANLADQGKLAFLKKLEHARKSPADAGEAALADMLCTVAAALASPRRSVTPNEEAEDGTGAFTCEAQAPREVSAKLQQLARSLLLKLLHEWKSKGYPCSAIQCALERVKLQLSTFEDQVMASQRPTVVGFACVVS